MMMLHRCTAAALLLLVGCTQHLDPQYGESGGKAGLGINGFGMLRRSFEINGWKTQTVRQLGQRAKSLDALVWTPNDFHGRPAETITWLQDWLADQPRTLIYVLPDEGSSQQYWEQTRAAAEPSQRLEYQRRYARAVSEAMNGPFQPGYGSETRIAHLWFQATLRSGDLPRWQILPHGTAPLTTSTSSQPPASFHQWLDIWDTSDYKIEDKELQQQVLISDDQNVPLLVRLTTPSADDAEAAAPTPYWIDSVDALRRHRESIQYGLGQSQVLVVSSGSLVNNFALTTTPSGRSLAERLLAAADQQTPGRPRSIGFLLTGPYGATVNDSTSSNPSGVTGTEFLTVWPLSVVTLHLALLGLVACLIMVPIFGRPRQLPQRVTNDFTDHLRAVGALLSRTGGVAFARQKVRDYQRTVRGDSSITTPQPESPPPSENAPHV